MKSAEQFISFGQGNIEAMVKSSQIVATGLQDLSKQMAANAQAALDESMSTFRAIAGVRSMKEAFEMQANFARSSVEKVMSQTGQFTEASLQARRPGLRADLQPHDDRGRRLQGHLIRRPSPHAGLDRERPRRPGRQRPGLFAFERLFAFGHVFAVTHAVFRVHCLSISPGEYPGLPNRRLFPTLCIPICFEVGRRHSRGAGSARRSSGAKSKACLR